MAFWAFDTGGGGGGGAHPDKAAHDLLNIDADTLDAFDAADFIRFAQHTKALHDALGLDSATLDGFDSADFVRFAQHTKALHDALAIDAATLDGIDSLGFALAGHGHAGLAIATAVKAADEPRTNTNVYAADPELKFAIGADPNETWFYNITAFYTAPAAGDIKFRPSHTGASATVKLGRIGLDTTDSAPPTLVHSDAATETAGVNTGELGSSGLGAAVVYHSLDGVARQPAAGMVAGDVELEFTQITANATPSIVQALSVLFAVRVV